MATPSHVLTATDKALKAFFKAASIAALADYEVGDTTFERVVQGKAAAGKTLPVLICSSDTANRGRAKNWDVSGTISLKTDIEDEDGNSTDAAVDASTALETAVMTAMESLIPDDDRPQPLADAITAATIAAGNDTADSFLMTAFKIVRVSVGFDEDGFWTFAVDFNATVIV